MKGFILGCDISKNDVYVCLLNTESEKVLGSKRFPNNTVGVMEMDDWVSRKTKGEPYKVVMEATGVYHENLVDGLYLLDVEDIYIINPKLVKHYIASHNRRYKNDPSDAFMIASFGTAIGNGVNEVNVQKWKPFSQFYQEIRSYSRQMLSLKKTSTQLKNRMEALSFTKRTPKEILISTQQLIEKVDATIESYRVRLQSILDYDPDLKEKVYKVASIKGVSWETVLHIVCETDGFSSICNARQLVAYAGLDVPDEQSGRCRKPGHISKAGNAQIRLLLYMPAMVAATRKNGIYNAFYNKLIERYGGKGKGKKVLVAVMRKMLILIYTLWRDDCVYDPKHVWNQKVKSDKQRPELLLSKNNEVNSITEIK